MLTRIKLEKLFHTFDYDIELKTEGITILTGPNGYGKTTVLKILDALAKRNSLFFVQLPFNSIILEFADREPIEFTKNANGEASVKVMGKSTSILLVNDEKILRRLPYLDRVDQNRWLDHRTDEIITTDELFHKIQDILSKGMELPELLNQMDTMPSLPMIPVYFIREQRLLHLLPNVKHRLLTSEEPSAVFKNTVEEYALELSNTIKETLAKSSKTTQELDSSFPRRLFDQQDEISAKEFNERFNKVKAIQKMLSGYGFSEFKEDSHPVYQEKDARALAVYIDDTEKKLAVFTELLDKLNLFTAILNEHRFTFKQIQVSKEKGFTLSTSDGKPLALTNLSAGEQQEIVVLYELLFKVKSGTLVLIDEPELSLHVVWQQEFLNDLAKIVAWQKIHTLIATHSPQIINEHWDLVVDLWELHHAKLTK